MTMDRSPVRPDRVHPPLVSAVVITYNYARFLPDAIESVLSQTYENLEIVVVDDGSTDQTPETVGRYENRGVRYVRRRHAGPGQARNAGVAVTSGPVIAFLDGDDAWLPDRVALEVAHLEKHPELALVGGHAFACDEALRPTNVVHVPKKDAGHMLERLLVHNVVLNPSSVLIRRTALQAVGGFSEIPVGQDWDTWIKVAEAFPIGFVDRPVALVRRHPGSISPKGGRHRIDIDIDIVDRHLQSLTPAWKRPLVRRRARSVSYFHAAHNNARHGNKSTARRQVLISVALDPLTLTRRKAALLTRLFVSESLVKRLRGAVKGDDELAGMAGLHAGDGPGA